MIWEDHGIFLEQLEEEVWSCLCNMILVEWRLMLLNAFFLGTQFNKMVREFILSNVK